MSVHTEDVCRAWLAYGLLPLNVLEKMFDVYGSASEILKAFRNGSFPADKLPEHNVTVLRQHAGQDELEHLAEDLERFRVHVVSWQDALYPVQLLQIQDPPGFLFMRGNAEALQTHCIAMVGSRKASFKALNATQRISREVSCAGVTVVSGLAAGIDSAAHQGCMEGFSPTVAVLGNGPDTVYPSENRNLEQRILESGGLLLTEYGFGEKPLGWHFPYRNRIISGLCEAVVLMEARIKSGSMTTVSHALNQGREVFAWPGEPDSVHSEAAHQLIREGARYFTTAGDLLEDMGWTPKKADTTEKRELPPELSNSARKLYEQLKGGQQSFDQLVQVTGDTPSGVNTDLTLLQMLDLVHALPGKQYIMAENKQNISEVLESWLQP